MSRSYTSSPPHVPPWRVAGHLFIIIITTTTTYLKIFCRSKSNVNQVFLFHPSPEVEAQVFITGNKYF
jgi:hypothetical protein